MTIDNKPILMWVGGKQRLASQIIEHFPTTYNAYHEPFIGGGAIFMRMCEIGHKFYISDLNDNLINFYQVVRDDIDNLVVELTKPEYINTKEQYTINRLRFNEIKNNTDLQLERACLFFYLNRTGFQGVYKETSTGKYNNGYGYRKAPDLIQKRLSTLKDLHKKLTENNTKIFQGSYETILERAQEGDLVYLDPPYFETFSKYNKQGFNKEEHERLKQVGDNLREKGVYVILSNSNTEFIRELYYDYEIHELEIKYSTFAKKMNAKKTNELLIIGKPKAI